MSLLCYLRKTVKFFHLRIAKNGRDAFCYLPIFMIYNFFCFKAAVSFCSLYKISRKSNYFLKCVYSTLSEKVNRISLHNSYDDRGKEKQNLASRSFTAVCYALLFWLNIVEQCHQSKSFPFHTEKCYLF